MASGWVRQSISVATTDSCCPFLSFVDHGGQILLREKRALSDGVPLGINLQAHSCARVCEQPTTIGYTTTLGNTTTIGDTRENST